jgi:hypothetical protein
MLDKEGGYCHGNDCDLHCDRSTADDPRFANWQITTGWGKLTADSAVLRAAGMGDSALASLGTGLWVVALLSLNLAGIAVFAGQGWWRGLAIGAAVVSLLVMGLFWQPSFIIGAAVNVGILVALLWARWPTPALLGA